MNISVFAGPRGMAHKDNWRDKTGRARHTAAPAGDRMAVYGIDLGTTYSCVAQIDDVGRPTVLRNLEGADTTPSVVYF